MNVGVCLYRSEISLFDSNIVELIHEWSFNMKFKREGLKGKIHLILPVTKDRLSSLLKTQNDINFGLAKTSVKP